MSEKDALEAALPGAPESELGPLAAQLKAAIEIMEETRDEDTERHETARKEAARVATELNAVKSRLDDAQNVASYRNLLSGPRAPSKASTIGPGVPGPGPSASAPSKAGDLASGGVAAHNLRPAALAAIPMGRPGRRAATQPTRAPASQARNGTSTPNSR